jgi:hypothetical protein
MVAGVRSAARHKKPVEFRPSLMAFDLHCEVGHNFVFRQATGSLPAKSGIPLPDASCGVVKTYTGAGCFWTGARQSFREAVEE